MARKPRSLPLEPHKVRRGSLPEEDQALVAEAIRCLEQRYLVKTPALTSPQATRDYLKLHLYGLQYEVFAILYLDNRHRVLRYEELFRGTIDGASVHPREIVRKVYRGWRRSCDPCPQPSVRCCRTLKSDLRITQRIKDALDLIEVRVLDHMIIGDGEGTSLAERGYI